MSWEIEIAFQVKILTELVNNSVPGTVDEVHAVAHAWG